MAANVNYNRQSQNKTSKNRNAGTSNSYKNKSRMKQVRDRKEENSFGWYAQFLAHYVTFGLVKPPKTLRGDNYRYEFMKANPGIIVKGLYFCVYCGKPITKKGMQVDHIKPINLGGRNWTPNLAPACVKCNQAKKAKAGMWTVRGYIGKIIYSVAQSASNLITGVVTGRKDIFSRLSKYAWGATGVLIAWKWLLLL